MTWFAVALSADLKHGMTMPCCLSGTDLAIWRSASGQAFVWGDRCPHRGMRLSQGFVRGEALSCIYHGWQYGSDGGCVAIPAHPDLVPPKSICATTYQCAEVDGLIWATLAATSDPVPALKNTNSVRSIYIDAPLNTVCAHFGSQNATLIEVDVPFPLTIAVHPAKGGCTALHALTAQEQDRKDLSHWLEIQRAAIEGAAA